MSFFSKKQVRSVTTLAFATIDRKERQGDFPKRLRIGGRVVWIVQEIEQWIAEQIAKNRP